MFAFHCTVGVGVPVATVGNETSPPASTVTDAGGCVVMAGATPTDSVAELLVSVPNENELLNTASYL